MGGGKMNKPAAKKGNHSIRLTERDRQLLELLALHGCVSVSRIKSELWNEKDNLRAHYRRLGMLCRAGLIEKVGQDGNRSLGYRLTKKGKGTLFISTGNRELMVSRKSYGTQFEHDQLLIDIRRILTGSSIVREYKTELEVKHEIVGRNAKHLDWRQIPTIPDATFQVTLPGRSTRVALELELNGKSKARYRRIFKNHLLNSRWSVVFYIVKSDKLMGHLRDQLLQTKQKDVQVIVAKKVNGVYFCSLEKFLALGLFAPFSNGKEELSLGELAKHKEIGGLDNKA